MRLLLARESSSSEIAHDTPKRKTIHTAVWWCLAESHRPISMRVLTMIRKSRRGPLLLCCSLFVTWAMSSPDPTCSRGVKRGSICCSASCGDKCSSKGCSHAGCGAKCCCSSSIEKSDRLCSQNAAPCNLGRSTIVCLNPNLTTRHVCCCCLVFALTPRARSTSATT